MSTAREEVLLDGLVDWVPLSRAQVWGFASRTLRALSQVGVGMTDGCVEMNVIRLIQAKWAAGWWSK